MLSFARTFCPALIGAMLLLSVLGHAFHPFRLRDLLREHGMLPRATLLPAVIALTAAELVGGAAAVRVLASGRGGAVVALTSIGLGLAFACYLVVLLRHGPVNTSCGCTPFHAPLTEASLVPAVTLLSAGLMLAFTVAVGSQAPLTFLERAVASTAGIALAALAFLMPATMPAPGPEGVR